ncbi:MAG: CocE/NonD family hydrolase [Chloroflexi bacterium]|nr:CocE/NonD family hydrolase [Chloroflexota bacterium]
MARDLEPRYPIRRERGLRVPMPDGATLAADVFLPAEPGRWPVVLEYLPYRKNDTTWAGWHGHRYLAERGFATVRIDVRGTGDSEGTAEDEYCRQEQMDGVAAIAWLAEQPWSNGNVGLFGTSYGGFNAVQIAMHRPPALKAICPMHFTDRRYTDDCHYKGGALQMLYDVGTYGLAMVGRNWLPPRPDLTGLRWAAIWEAHLANEPWLLRWLAHPTEDEQWRQGSLCEDYAAIQCATFLIGGWRDGYTNCNLRTFAALTCPKKLLIGPWLHTRPHEGVPGPRIDHYREMARFFGHWLAGRDTGIMAEPPVTLYIQHYDPPRQDRRHTSGVWRAERGWPLARAREESLHLVGDALSPVSPATDATATLAHHPAVGTSFGMFSAGAPHVLPGDQRAEEAFSAVFTGSALTEPLVIIGQPRVVLHLATSVSIATIVARLCDVAPDGASALVTKGVLNLTHRESHADPTPLAPGAVYEIALDLDATAWQFAPGHRLRLSLSHADFPNTWPMPALAMTTLHHGPARPSRLVLPVVPPADDPLPTPDLIRLPDVVEPAPLAWRVVRDGGTGRTEVHIESQGAATIDGEWVQEARTEAVAIVDERDPARALVRGRQTVRYRWPSQTIELQSRGQITSDATSFQVLLHMAITVDGLPHISRRWAHSYPRHLL